jgi:cytochrome b561
MQIDRRADRPPRVYAWAHEAGIVKLNRHPLMVIAMHWGTVLALIIGVAAMFVRDAIEDDTYRQALLQVHRQLGLLLLLVAAWRITVRLRRGLANHAPNMAFLLRWAAGATHLFLYGLLLALPLVGWALTSAHGISLSFLGAIRLPAMVAADSEFADALNDYHIWLAWALLALVAAHAVAALWHHFVRRDTVLKAMLPGAAAVVQFPDRRRAERRRPPNSGQPTGVGAVSSMFTSGDRRLN